MSTTNAPAYAEEADVQEALQETSDSMTTTPLGTANVEAAIISASRWFRTAADTHFYDSNAAASDLISTGPVTTTDHLLDVPASPHRQRGQIFRADGDHGDVQYPNTRAGPYVRLRLPYHHVEAIDRLAVRDAAGETEDWVAGTQVQGRGEDYYLRVEGGSTGASYVYLHAGSIGPRTHFEDLVEVDLTYGRDWADSPWDDVRRGIAHVAAAELVVDDDIITQLPDNGSLAGVETQADQHLSAAMDRYLAAYMHRPIA